MVLSSSSRHHRVDPLGVPSLMHFGARVEIFLVREQAALLRATNILCEPRASSSRAFSPPLKAISSASDFTGAPGQRREVCALGRP